MDKISFQLVEMTDGQRFYIQNSGEKGSFWVKKRESDVPFLVLMLPPRPKMSGGKTDERLVCLCQGSRQFQAKETCCHIEAVEHFIKVTRGAE